MEKLKEERETTVKKVQQGMDGPLYKKKRLNPAAAFVLPILRKSEFFSTLQGDLCPQIEIAPCSVSLGPFQGTSAHLNPTSIFNFYARLPWGVPEAVSVLAPSFLWYSTAAYCGISMCASAKLNPAPHWTRHNKMIFAGCHGFSNVHCWQLCVRIGGLLDRETNTITFHPANILIHAQPGVIKPDLLVTSKGGTWP